MNTVSTSEELPTESTLTLKNPSLCQRVGGGMGAKTGLYLLPRHIQHHNIKKGKNASGVRGGYRSK